MVYNNQYILFFLLCITELLVFASRVCVGGNPQLQKYPLTKLIAVEYSLQPINTAAEQFRHIAALCKIPSCETKQTTVLVVKQQSSYLAANILLPAATAIKLD
jgi:hypothetical protein